MSLRFSSVNRSTRARQHARNRRRRLWALEGLESRVLLSGNPTYYTVNLTSDCGASSGTDAYPTAGTPSGDLLWAVTQANANTNAAGSVIDFDPTVFATLQTITLSSTLVLSESAGPEVVDGPSAGVVISGNNAVGVFQVDGGVTATLAGLTISGGSAGYTGGGVDVQNGGTLVVTNCTVTGNSAAFYGGGIYNYGTLTVTGSTVEGDSAGSLGGGIDNDGMLTVSGSTVEDNSADGGGGVYVSVIGTMTMINSTISNDSALIGGGVENSGTLTVTGCTIENNTATGTNACGGGIYNGGTLTVSDSTIANNSATYFGGGIFNSSSGPLMVTGSTIANNSTSLVLFNAGGGGIFNNGGPVTVSDSTISGNSTGPYGWGAGINNGGALTIINSTIANNSAGYDAGGGGIFNTGTLTAVNSTIAYNVSTGGGLYDNPGATATLDNTIVAQNTNNRYFYDGELFYNYGDDIDGAALASSSAYNLIGIDNTASLVNGRNGNIVVGTTNPSLGALAYNGGPTQTIALLAGSPALGAGSANIAGVVVPAIDQRGVAWPGSVVDIGAYGRPPASSIGPPTVYTVTDTSDSASDPGSLRYAIAQADLNPNLAGSVIQFDIPPTGPGYNAQMGSWTITLGPSNGPLVLHDPSGPLLIDGPGASMLTVSGGNAIEVFQVGAGPPADLAAGAPSTLAGLTIWGGSAYTGGGIGVTYGATLTVSGCTVAGNSASSNALGGGGIFSEGVLTLSGSVIQNDSAVSGGGIATANGAVTVTDSTIEDNVATGSGGGIWTYGGTVTVTGSTLSANSAPGGGGISTTEGAVTVINSTIEDNVTTTAGGGGINSDGSTVTVTGTAIEDNTATAAGGGGGIYNAGTMTVSDSTIAGNTAAAYGGGIFNWYGLLTVTDCTIENNSVSTYPDGGGGIINLDGALTVSSSTISGNSTGQYGPGGGIANGGTLTISNSTIASNSAGYDAFGGGIVNGFYDAGTLTAVNSTIAYNDAYNSGGGLSDTPGSTATLYNTIIAANTGGDGADDIAGAGVSSASAYNLVGVDETGSLTNGTDGNQVGVTSPGLASGPANNGGSTQTIAFMPGSPAIDTGRNGINGFTLFTDQRGYVPPAGVWDIGAYQLNAIPPSAPTATLSAANVTPAGYGQTAYTFSITFASNAAIEASTLAGAVVAVVPPAGVGSPITATVVSTAANGTTDPFGNAQSFTVTYEITPPGGSWSPADNGTYSVTLGGSPVTDVDRTAIATGNVGSFAVQGVSTTTSLTASANPSVSGQSVTFTATVTPNISGSGTPGGTIQFVIDGSNFGSPVTLVNGTATSAPISTLSVASHTIQALYSGNSIFLASTGTLTQAVNKDNTTTSVVPSTSTSSFGQAVTFTTKVTANPPGSGTPSGTVDLLDSTTGNDLTPGGVSLSSGTASFSISSLPVGSNSIKVTYSGDSNFLTSSTTISTITINQSLIVLDPTAGGALSLSGNATIKLTGGVFVDSSSSSAISASGNAAVKASVIDVHGGVQKSGNVSFSPAATTGSATLPDPLASLAEPSASGPINTESLSGNSSATIKPGIYSQISVSGNGTLTLSSGIYIIEGGGFTVSGNASVTGSGVMIFNAGSKYPSTGGTYGGITLSGNGSYNLSPPTTGTYAGIVIFQSRDNAKALTLSGNASGMTGTIYAAAAQLAESGNAQLNAAAIVDTIAVSGNGVANVATLDAPSGSVAYTPAQIRAAYGISALPLDGTGQTIAIVDAYDDPEIFPALDAFDSQFGLTASGSTLYAQYGPASSFLTVLNQYGQATSLPSTDPNGPGTNNWELEEALDVEWAHAIAPGAQIILVEANSQSLSDLMAAVGAAAHQPGVSVVSMSWGFPEGQAVFAADEAAYDSVFSVPGVTFVASTGDYGAADPEYPAFSRNVVAVGGTSLTLNADGSYNSETGWGYYSNAAGAFIGSGGGISLYEPEPAYQQGVQSTGGRSTPDVSLVADPATGAWIADPYNLDPSNPFEIVGGTSLSAPAWAGLVALVNQGRAAAGEPTLNTIPTDTQQALYMLPQTDYNAITSGNNGYSASAGYNLATGLGTPVASLLVPDLIAYRGPGTSYAGAPVAPLQNAGLVNSGTTDSGPMDVFSVFDSFTVTNVGLGHAHTQGSAQAESARGHEANATGRGVRRLTDIQESSSIVSSSVAGDGLAQPSTRPETAFNSAIDQVLGTLEETNSHDTLIGEVAFEQVSSGTRKPRGSAAIGTAS